MYYEKPRKRFQKRSVTRFTFWLDLILESQDVLVKLQIITLAAKLSVLNPAEQTLGLIARYIFSLARYDLNYDVRDRARVLSSLLTGVGSPVLTPDDGITPFEERGGVVLRSEQVKVVLFNGKTNVTDDEHTGTYEQNSSFQYFLILYTFQNIPI